MIIWYEGGYLGRQWLGRVCEPSGFEHCQGAFTSRNGYMRARNILNLSHWTEPVRIKGTTPILKNHQNNELSYAPID
jgi:hypothetical protein